MKHLSKGLNKVFESIVYSCSPEKLCDAIEKGEPDEKILKLIEHCRNPNGNIIFSPIVSVLEKRNANILEALLDAKTNPNIEIPLLGIKPISYAIELGYFEGAERLAKRGADVNIQDRFGPTLLNKSLITILKKAPDSGREKAFLRMLRTFLQKGAETNVRNEEEVPPLAYIVGEKEYGNKKFLLDTAQELVNNGAIITDNILNLARMKSTTDIIKYLKVEKAKQARNTRHMHSKQISAQ